MLREDAHDAHMEGCHYRDSASALESGMPTLSCDIGLGRQKPLLKL